MIVAVAAMPSSPAVPSFAQLDVHQDHVRLPIGDQGDGGGRVSRLADDVEIRLEREQGREGLPDERLVVDEQDADHGRTGRRGVAGADGPPLSAT